MAQVKEVEMFLANEIRRLRKEAAGKGPAFVQTYIHGDVIFIKVDGIWTYTEKMMIQISISGIGAKQTGKLYVDIVTPKLESAIKKITDIPIRDMTMNLHPECNRAHGVIYLEQDLEKAIRSAPPVHITASNQQE